MRISLSLLLSLTVVTAACTKHPTAEQCEQAWDHVASVLTEVAREDMARLGPGLPPEAQKMMADHMADARKQVRSSPMGEQIHQQMIEACQAKPAAYATCILDAASVEALVDVCKMKASRGGYRGATSLSWPD